MSNGVGALLVLRMLGNGPRGGGGGYDDSGPPWEMLIFLLIMVALLIGVIVYGNYVDKHYEWRAQCQIGTITTFQTPWRQHVRPNAPAPGKHDSWDGCIEVGSQTHWLKPGETCYAYERKIGGVAYEVIRTWPYQEDFDTGSVCGDKPR